MPYSKWLKAVLFSRQYYSPVGGRHFRRYRDQRGHFPQYRPLCADLGLQSLPAAVSVHHQP